MFGTREGGKPYKTQAVVFFCRFCETISLPRNRFCLITQRFSVCWGRVLRDETKTAARETGARIH